MQREERLDGHSAQPSTSQFSSKTTYTTGMVLEELRELVDARFDQIHEKVRTRLEEAQTAHAERISLLNQEIETELDSFVNQLVLQGENRCTFLDLVLLPREKARMTNVLSTHVEDKKVEIKAMINNSLACIFLRENPETLKNRVRVLENENLNLQGNLKSVSSELATAIDEWERKYELERSSRVLLEASVQSQKQEIQALSSCLAELEHTKGQEVAGLEQQVRELQTVVRRHEAVAHLARIETTETKQKYQDALDTIETLEIVKKKNEAELGKLSARHSVVCSSLAGEVARYSALAPQVARIQKIVSSLSLPGSEKSKGRKLSGKDKEKKSEGDVEETDEDWALVGDQSETAWRTMLIDGVRLRPTLAEEVHQLALVLADLRGLNKSLTDQLSSASGKPVKTKDSAMKELRVRVDELQRQNLTLLQQYERLQTVHRMGNVPLTPSADPPASPPSSLPDEVNAAKAQSSPTPVLEHGSPCGSASESVVGSSGGVNVASQFPSYNSLPLPTLPRPHSFSDGELPATTEPSPSSASPLPPPVTDDDTVTALATDTSVTSATADTIGATSATAGAPDAAPTQCTPAEISLVVP